MPKIKVLEEEEDCRVTTEGARIMAAEKPTVSFAELFVPLRIWSRHLRRRISTATQRRRGKTTGCCCTGRACAVRWPYWRHADVQPGIPAPSNNMMLEMAQDGPASRESEPCVRSGQVRNRAEAVQPLAQGQLSEAASWMGVGAELADGSKTERSSAGARASELAAAVSSCG